MPADDFVDATDSRPDQVQPTTEHKAGSLEIAKVAIRIPPFWHAQPELWIAQVESQFIAGGITNDKTKYHTVVAAIESNVLAQISDIILCPPVNEMYATLRKRLIDQFADSEQKRIKKLLQDLELGDMRPSQLLREMRQLAGKEMNDTMLKSIWMNRLPQQIRSIISISTESLGNVALLADKIIEVSDGPHVHAVATPGKEVQDTIAQQINELTKEISNLKSAVYQRSRGYERRRSQSRSRSQTPRTSDEICWYHMKFGENAKKCRKPCTKSLN